MKNVSSALISVFNKNKIEHLCQILSENNVKIYSTGGTYDYINSLGIKLEKVEDITTYPSILNGRVKTLHPKIFGGILKTNSKSDIDESKKYEIPDIDLVVVDLYPFEETVKSSSNQEDIIEKIDIGGVSLIRAAAKNYENVICISSKDQYNELINILKNDCKTDIKYRKKLAFEAFQKSSDYDYKISSYLNNKNIISHSDKATVKELRYGENPHQNGRFIGQIDRIFEQIHGKDISYNNILDIDSAIGLLKDLETKKTVFLIHKHNNPCGVSVRDNLLDAYLDALSCDNVSAFGGILTTNQTIDVNTAKEIDKLFFEVLIAPNFSNSALDILKSKKNRIIIKLKSYPTNKIQNRSCLNGMLEQDIDDKTEKFDDFEVVTKIRPDSTKFGDIVLASIIAKHTKSNCIAIVKNKQLIGLGMGQVSRIDALNQAIEKSKKFGFDLNGSCLASDAFFPFSDCVEISHINNINAIVQPGGSIRDKDSIDFCNKNGMSMVFSGIRHFRH